MKKYLALSFALTAFTFFSCGNDKKKTEPEVIEVETKAETPEYTAQGVDVTFTNDTFKEVFTQYIEVKTALVNTNAEKTAEQAAVLNDLFVKMEANETAISAAQTIMETKEVEIQRTAFVKLTAEVEKMMQGAITEGVIYKQYCPMAFGNTGASWLSESKDIYNPYFGDKMLRCGRIEAVLE